MFIGMIDGSRRQVIRVHLRYPVWAKLKPWEFAIYHFTIIIDHNTVSLLNGFWSRMPVLSSLMHSFSLGYWFRSCSPSLGLHPFHTRGRMIILLSSHVALCDMWKTSEDVIHPNQSRRHPLLAIMACKVWLKLWINPSTWGWYYIIIMPY